jgi:hypothetical protein
MPNERFSPAEIAARGEAIYEREIRPQVESQCAGQFLVLDIETGDYEVGPDDLLATKRVLAKHPNAILHGLRIGHRAAYRLGRSFQVCER